MANSDSTKLEASPELNTKSSGQKLDDASGKRLAEVTMLPTAADGPVKNPRHRGRYTGNVTMLRRARMARDTSTMQQPESSQRSDYESALAYISIKHGRKYAGMLELRDPADALAMIRELFIYMGEALMKIK